MKEHEIPCELCGEVYDPDELIPFDDRLICPECLENETTLCACCGQRIWLTDNAGNDNTPLCQTCYDQSYMTCSECGRLIHCEDTYYLDDSDEPLCLTCLEEEQEPAIARILYFVKKHWEELLKFSRRTPRWAARYGYKDRPQEILEHAKKGSHAGRYSCVNLENRTTIEFRMFRGTLKLNSLRKVAEQVQGTFVFTVLDAQDNLYFVHGDNPLCLYHFPKQGIYVYASTQSILEQGLTASGLSFLKKPVEVKTDEGDILRIDRHGEQKLQHFCINSFCPPCYSDAIEWYPKPLSAGHRNPDAYWEGLVKGLQSPKQTRSTKDESPSNERSSLPWSGNGGRERSRPQRP